MLENDLLFSRFLDRYLPDLSDAELCAFDQLLELPDQELFELLFLRKEPDGAADNVRLVVLAKIRSV
jgi:antitoxin CptB